MAIEVKTTENIDDPIWKEKERVKVGTEREYTISKLRGYVTFLKYHYTALLCFDTPSVNGRADMSDAIRYQVRRKGH
jgi:hypothetical protein